jgi:hypothetical protein
VDTLADLLAELLGQDSSGFDLRYAGDGSRRLAELDEQTRRSVISGLGTIRQRATEAEALAIAVWGEHPEPHDGQPGSGRTGHRSDDLIILEW